MKIYTKNGDKGMTSLCGGHCVAKDDLRVEAYGTIDELNAHLGLLISFLNQDCNPHFASLIHPLEHLQENLFVIGSVLSTYTETDQTLPVIAKRISEMEDSIDSWTAEIPSQSSFILPGGTVSAAQCHVCRTVCRRAERRIISLSHQVLLSPDILSFMNRLSDYFFVLSRYLNIKANECEKRWENTCK